MLPEGPVLGGEYVMSNVEPSDIAVHYSIAGQIHELVSNLAEGTPIIGVTLK